MKDTYSTIATTNTLSMALYASDEEKNRETELRMASLVIEKPFDLGSMVLGGTPVEITFKLNGEGKLTLYAVINGCPPFELEFTPVGALTEEEMEDASKSMDRKSVT